MTAAVAGSRISGGSGSISQGEPPEQHRLPAGYLAPSTSSANAVPFLMQSGMETPPV